VEPYVHVKRFAHGEHRINDEICNGLFLDPLSFLVAAQSMNNLEQDG
jgi:hypothetical protein